MAQVTSPIILDSTGQQIHSDLQQIKNVLTTPSAAEDITFDNTGTGMQADDVQDAITELKSNLTDLIYYKELSHSYSISASGSTFWNPHSDTGFDVLGYTPIGIIGFTAGGTNAVPLSLYVEDNQYSMGLKNTSSGSITGNCKYIVMYIKTSLLS